MNTKLSGLLVAALIVAIPASSQAVTKCKVKVDRKTGVIKVDARDVVGSMMWGGAAGEETSAFFNESACVVGTKARRCTLAADGTVEAITPPSTCFIHLADDGAESCAAFISGCTPGVRDAADVSDGVNCWDVDENGLCDLVTEDINTDGFCDVLDCEGPQGSAGADGAPGTPGADGADGRECWDLNGNGSCDLPAEDTNTDSSCDVLDCRGTDGAAGAPGTPGADGLKCWDLNGNSACDLATEDANSDLACDVADCRAQDPESKIVFITSTRWAGDLGGLDGADAKCNERAAAAGLSGTFRAWLSDSTGSPDTRFNKSSLPYFLVNGVMIAASYGDLTDGLLVNPVDHDEFGASIGQFSGTKRIWTGTLYNGQPDNSVCSNWASSSVSFFGDIGILVSSANSIEFSWTDSIGVTCEGNNHLYCFEQ